VTLKTKFSDLWLNLRFLGNFSIFETKVQLEAPKVLKSLKAKVVLYECLHFLRPQASSIFAYFYFDPLYCLYF
jgi:hypothetical protein